MRDLKRSALWSAMALCACSGGSPDTRDNTSATNTAISAQQGEGTAQAATVAQATPRLDCASVQSSKIAENLLGITIGMKPDEASRILICHGYTATYPTQNDARQVADEAAQGIFHRDFGKQGQRDYVRIFYEGAPERQQVYFVARAHYFDESPPTMEAVSQQFLNSYPALGGLTKAAHGILQAGFINPAKEATGYIQERNVQSHCTGTAFLHDASSAYSSIMNKEQYPDLNCGLSLTFEAIPNGRNMALVYLAHYRLANPQLGYALREQRQKAEASAVRKKMDAETQSAKDSGTLPDL